MMEHDYKNYPELTNSQMQELEFSSPHKQITSNFFAKVVKVHDGDTITLQAEFRDFTFPLRFLNIDAKELNEGGEEARDWLKDMLEGEEVEILIDSTNRVDKYGRLLGSVFYRGMNIGDEEIYLGLALPFGTQGEGQVPAISKMVPYIEWQ